MIREKENMKNGLREKELNKELEDELLMFKKEVVEQHMKGFFKAVR